MNEDLKIFALGGLDEVGENCYILESKNDIIILDCGIKFINNNNLVDGIIPNFGYLWHNKNKIKGLFISHGHEDHIGGIPYLLHLIPNIPVFGSNFTIALIKSKFTNKEKNFIFNIYNDDTIINTVDFKIKFFRVTHSIPHSFGFIIETNEVRILFTGDYKIDLTNPEEKFDLFKLAEYGKKGIDLLLSESTNAELEGNTPSENKVIKRLESIITIATGRVIITSFASNVYRLKKIMDIAKKTERKIILLGSSLIRIMKVIQKSSLWKLESSIFLKAADISKVEKHKIIIFCTGSQGENRAVLGKLAKNNYVGWKIEKGDSVILTSSPIMDNKTNVELNNNLLFDLGAEIYENCSTDLLHASGHGCQEDLKLVLNLTKTRYFMPIHGDYRMLKKHAMLAQETGVLKENIFVCKKGDIISCKGKDFFLSEEKIEQIASSYVSEGKLVSNEELQKDIQLREKMLKGGIMLVVIFIKDKIKKLPYIFTYGFLNMEKSKFLVDIWKNKIKEFLEVILINSKSIDNKLIEISIIKFINEILLLNWKVEKPLIKLIINE